MLSALEKKKNRSEESIQIFSVAGEIISHHLCMIIPALKLNKCNNVCQGFKRKVNARVGRPLRSIIHVVCNEHSSYSNIP